MPAGQGPAPSPAWHAPQEQASRRCVPIRPCAPPPLPGPRARLAEVGGAGLGRQLRLEAAVDQQVAMEVAAGDGQQHGCLEGGGQDRGSGVPQN